MRRPFGLPVATCTLASLGRSLPLMDAEFDSALARKLNSFMEMSKDELDVLVELQSNRVMIKRGQTLFEEGQTGHKALFLQTRLGLQLQDPA